jgi:hypothetical protein
MKAHHVQLEAGDGETPAAIHIMITAANSLFRIPQRDTVPATSLQTQSLYGSGSSTTVLALFLLKVACCKKARPAKNSIFSDLIIQYCLKSGLNYTNNT